MATIQIREIPEDAYEVIRRRARAEGQSIQAYMRDRVVDLARQPTKREIVEAIDTLLEGGGADVDMDQLVADLAADRR